MVPRWWPQTFRSRMAFLYGLLSLLVGLPTYWYVSSVYREQLIVDRKEQLLTLATSAATVLSENLNERRREVELLAKTSLYRSAPLDSPEFQPSLERLQKSYPHYSWIGLADTNGTVRAATAGHLLGRDVSARPWFAHGLGRVYVGDVHEAALLAKLLHTQATQQPIRFIDFASPVLDDRGQLRGVLAAHAHWRWAGNMLRIVEPHNAKELALDVLILDRNQQVIYPENQPGWAKPPADVVPQGTAMSHGFQAWESGVVYLTASAPLADPAMAEALGWRVVVRQPEQVVVAGVNHLLRLILLAAGLAAVAFWLLAWLGARKMSQPLERLTDMAHRIQRGEPVLRFGPDTGALEIRRLTCALEGMATTLLEQKQALELSNQELEAKVVARTAELHRLNEELNTLAHTDALTGLPNRLRSTGRLQEAFARLQQHHEPYAIAMMDIDFFKRINDTYGHATGDAVLRHVSALVRQTLRPGDFVGRVGGEEFMVVWPQTEAAHALALAEQIRQAVAAATVAPVGQVTLSVGVCAASALDDSAEEALRLADEALYQAKKAGRNQVVLHQPPGQVPCA